VEVTLRLTVSQSVCLGIEHPCGTCDHILFPVGMLLSEICFSCIYGAPPAICSVITQWSESLKTRNHTLLSHLRLPQPAGPGSRIYITQEQGGQLYPWEMGSLYVVSYDSHGYGRGILTLPLPGGTGPCIYNLQGKDGSVQSQVNVQSNVKVTLRPMRSQSVCPGGQSTRH
jgi:hypothetical protein